MKNIIYKLVIIFFINLFVDYLSDPEVLDHFNNLELVFNKILEEGEE